MPATGLDGEDRLVAWLRRTMPGGGLIGDDAAILDPEAWAVTVDTQVAGVHQPVDLDPAWSARRLLAVNLSDLAAMGARPAYAFLALGAPRDYDRRRFLRAFGRAAAACGLALAGGDLSRQPRLSAALTLLGRRAPHGRWLRRTGARPGDALWVGGSLGEAALGLALLAAGAGLEGRAIRLPAAPRLSRRLGAAARRAVRRQLRPAPQLDLGESLATSGEPVAAIDISDGLAKDLHRLCRASGVGAEIVVERLPRPPRFDQLARAFALDPLDLTLFGGEDYVLLFSLPARCSIAETLGCHRIGTVRDERGVWLRSRDRPRRRLPDRGWDHLKKQRAPRSRGS